MARFTHSADDWGKAEDRDTVNVPVPVGADGYQHSIPVFGTRTEVRFLARLLATITPEQFQDAMDYAYSVNA